MNDFDARLDGFVDMVLDVITEDHQRNGFTFPMGKIAVDPNGKKYARIVKYDGGNNQSVYCFVDKATGDILKSASWKTPAKIARGSIWADDFGKSCCGPYGAAYLT